MTNEKRILELFSNLAIFFKVKIHENDAVSFKTAYQSINVKTLDPRYKFPLTQSFLIDFNSFLKTVLDNLSKKKIKISFIEQNENDIGLVFHYSDLDCDNLAEVPDNLYRINGMYLDRDPNTTEYPNLRQKFRSKLGKYIAQQAKGPLTEVVCFEMKDVITYLFVNFSELSTISNLQTFAIEFEILHYKDVKNTECQECYSLNKDRISIGARLSYSYLESGTLATGKLPLYNIGTLHP